MCGIAGYFGSKKILRDQIQSCLKLMHRRGPDAASYMEKETKKGEWTYLLHSRLNIIDLHERANQPFYFGSKVLVFNGELYNYLELKQILQKKGCSFTTTSDTEVLIKTLDTFGWPGLDQCEGMWAFALYDLDKEELLLSRDRFGEKPLYLYKDSSGLYFGSEIKFIFELLGHKLDINLEHIYRYLVNGYKSLYKEKNSFFVGIEELDPASVLILDSKGYQEQKRYWQPRCEPEESMTYKEAVEGAREILFKSVQLRLRADVPLAFCMSGGVDSNSLISIAKKVHGYDVHGFTIVNTDSRYEEQEMVDYVVKELGLKHTSIPVKTADFIPKLRTLVRQHDAPVYTITYYAHWLLMESIASNGYRISISGTAADELFTGYFDHHLFYLYEIRDDRNLFSESLGAWKSYIQPVVRNPLLQDPETFLNNPHERDHIYLNSKLFSDYLYDGWNEPFNERNYTSHILRNRMLNEMFHEAVPVILHEDDLNAMYYSIENRSPYLDRSLFEFCNHIPSRYLIQDGAAKAVLRDAMKGIVPDNVIRNRKKVGFNVPIFSFLDVKDPKVKSYLLDESPIFEYVRKDKIESLIQKSDLPNSESKFLFYFLNSKIFLEEFLN